MSAHNTTLSYSQRVAQSFGARAAQYHEHALLQRETAGRLVDFLTSHGDLPALGLVAEIGCGTGLLTERLVVKAQRYLATDIAPEMVACCKARLTQLPHLSFAVQDGEQLRFAEAPGAIVTNLTAQWFQDPAAGLARLATQTRLLAFSVPLAGSFPEWEQAFRDMGQESGLLSLPQEHALKDALSTLTGRTAHFMTSSHVIHYENARAFAESFRSIGADQPRPGYRPSPIRPVLKRFAQGLNATARILYGLIRQVQA